MELKVTSTIITRIHSGDQEIKRFEVTELLNESAEVNTYLIKQDGNLPMEFILRTDRFKSLEEACKFVEAECKIALSQMMEDRSPSHYQSPSKYKN